MRNWQSLIHPYPCKWCGVTVRSVNTTSGDLITISDEPVAFGEWIPWPSERHTGIAVAKRLTVPVLDQESWVSHSCR